MKKSPMRIIARAVAIMGLLAGQHAFASEQAKSVYLLGATASMAGMTPPPGLFASSMLYGYSGDATGAAAVRRITPLAGFSAPFAAELTADARVRVKAEVAINVFAMLWVAPQEVLGGHFGIGALLPVGYQKVNVDVNALAKLQFPNGTVLQKGASLGVSDDTFNVGDPLATAFIGWKADNWHWKLTGLVNIPIGAYNKNSLVNMGFNRWAADLTASVTWLDPATGLEVSLAPGITFNGKNPDLNYKTGTEFHAEGALMLHLSPAFSFGVTGYHYQQISGDSGSGAVLGSFKGRVSALGPNLGYNFQLGSVPVLTSARWLHEFNAKNRLQGDAGILTVTIPLGGAPSH